MARTLADLRTVVRFQTKEPYGSTSYATDAITLLFANEAILQIRSRIKDKLYTNVPNSISDASDVTVAGTRLYSYPANLMEINNILVDGDKVYLANTEDLINYFGHNWWKITGRPSRYYIEDVSGTRKVGFCLTPGTSNWVISFWGTKKSTNMTTGTDTVDLDERLFMAACHFVCQRIEEGRDSFSRAKYFEDQYERELSKFLMNATDSNEQVEFLPASVPTD
jgi:hypothetical protein